MILVFARWPRTFSSLTTRVLDAGGCPAFRDEGEQWPGAWQHAAAMADPVGVLGPLLDGQGVVKVFAGALNRLQCAGLHPQAVLVPLRPWAESNASWVALGKPQLHDEQDMLAAYGCMKANAERAGVPWLEFQAHDLIDCPEATAAQIAEFAGIPDERVPAMAACVDPSLRHHRI